MWKEYRGTKGGHMKSSFYLVQCTSYMFELNSIFIMYVDVNVEGGNCSIIDEL